ncbi:D-alanyl-D-alanine carboxypeptidase precursor [Rubripirellula lacrimiformis]|uniref:D-alanyl-D-alanine carboxypeptidase n=1 Tax=Rubripirellula lacrimiformis TaxID=1930273 RepID=A0A517NCX9_9BACT|nr:serine hydrolase [Rubripirellula lacrimiformis]QDT04994.1 D-alanyl-D-alanine carboxypeptidase precursor [Rubripirellula lacrimiformis]
MKIIQAVSRSAVFVFLCWFSGFGLTAFAQEQSEQLAAKLAELCQKHDVPAMAAAVVNTDGLVESACYGNRKRGTSDMVALTDRFPIGSNTKSMTATLAAVLVESGKMQWETTIGEVWPKATDEHIHPKLKSVTLDQLLSHQSGLPANVSDISATAWAGFFGEKQSPVLERRSLLKGALSTAPATVQGKFVYSNLGYAIASAMLETRAGESFESLMKKHVFAPLEMRSADFRSMKSAAALQPPLLWGHQAANGDPVDPRSVGAENPTVYAAAGTVHLSIEDYAKYASWQLAGSASPVLRTQEAFDHLHDPQVEYNLPGAKYGSGWIMLDTAMGPALNHAGSNTNAFALIWLFPESNLGAIVFANSGQQQAFTACDEMIAHLMAQNVMAQNVMAQNGEPDAGPTKSTPNQPPAADAGQVSLDRLVGRYQLTPNFIFDVTAKGDQLLVGITNQPTQEVFADSPTKWSYRGVKAQLEFHLRAKGPAYALTLHQNGAAQKAKRIRE